MTTSSAPQATATPAEWSSIPIAIRCFLSRSTWPRNPASGACTDSAIPASRATSPNRSAHGYSIQKPPSKSISQAR